MFQQIYQHRMKYFGILLEEKYNSKSLKDGFESLKGRDQAIGKYLEDANESLPEDEKYTFYLVQFKLKQPGGINRMYLINFVYYIFVTLQPSKR